jgi:uncharacterized membrane protein YhhN
MLCSLSFVGIAVLFSTVSKHWNYGTMLLFPLVLCCIGDLFMGLYQVRHKKRQLFAGMVFFALAHLGLILMLFVIDSTFNVWNVAVPLVVVISFIVLKRKVHLHLGKMMLPACVYSVFLAMMLSKSLQYTYFHVSIGAAWIGVAGLLFFISDFTIIFLYFYKFQTKEARQKIHYANLSTYYFGILAFDMSILYMAGQWY